ncbi:MAG: reverse transcriptase-like protein [archaeon]|nr:reverse transcriptase-like protein [archaeon]
MMKKLIISSDGASKGNPGPAGIGIVICDESGRVVKEHEEFIGTATNNVAEYQALIKALELATHFSKGEVNCFSDSELMVKQLKGEYEVRNVRLHDLFLQVREKERKFEKVKYSYISREEEHLKRADKLANLAISGKISSEGTFGELEGRKDGWDHFVKGKELFSKWENDLSLEHAKEIEMKFRKAIELNPRLWAPHYYLGRLFYLTEKYSEAKVEFEKNIEKKPDSEPAKYYLTELMKKERIFSSFPERLEEVMDITNNFVLLNHALIEWFENTLRGVVQKVLEKKYGEEWWWEGVPDSVREKYGIRSQTTRLKEERDLSQLYFIDFYDYGKIIEANKGLLSPYLKNLKEWEERLDDLEPIRNAIMHCRAQYLSEETISKLKESCIELQKLMEKMNEAK